MKHLQELAEKYATTIFHFYDHTDKVTAEFVRTLREDTLDMTQSYFAVVLGVSRKTVQRWEKGKKIDKFTALVLYMISQEPELLTKYAFSDTGYDLHKDDTDYTFLPEKSQVYWRFSNNGHYSKNNNNNTYDQTIFDNFFVFPTKEASIKYQEKRQAEIKKKRKKVK